MIVLRLRLSGVTITQVVFLLLDSPTARPLALQVSSLYLSTWDDTDIALISLTIQVIFLGYVALGGRAPKIPRTCY